MEELYHHGIRGQKWGVRRFQNDDGSLTTLGRKRYGQDAKKLNKLEQDINKTNKKFNKSLERVGKAYRRPAISEFSINRRKRANEYARKQFLKSYHLTNDYIKRVSDMKINYGENNVAKKYISIGEYYYKMHHGIPVESPYMQIDSSHFAFEKKR